MESIKDVLNMITPNCYLASVDLKKAFYTVPIFEPHQNYLKFYWDGPYKFKVMPNGYSDAMRTFTKLLKPPFSLLRRKGHVSVVYVDDTLLQGDTYQECYENTSCTIALLQSLGFTIHPEKSVLFPTQHIEFLRFDIDTISMTLRLTKQKREKIKAKCTQILTKSVVTIRSVASLVGNMVATKEAIPLAPLYFKRIENAKIKALAENKGNFEAKMPIEQHIRDDLTWWVNNLDTTIRSITPKPIDKIIYTDASRQGWGAYDGLTRTKGQWTQLEWENTNINALEIKAAYFGLLSLCSGDVNLHIKVMVDNMTAVAYINHMGGSKSPVCQSVTRDLWTWAEQKNIWLTAAHIPGIENKIADEESRQFNEATEWSLTPTTFQKIVNIYGKPDIDLFATRLNYKVIPYVSWYPDPTCQHTNALSITWDYNTIYCFPPFSLIWKTLSKIRRERVDAIVIVPQWPTQSWYPFAMQMLINYPRYFTSAKANLYLPQNPTQIHPLYPKMKLLALHLSGEPSKTASFRQALKKSSFLPGEPAPEIDTTPRLKGGKNIVTKGAQIHCLPL